MPIIDDTYNSIVIYDEETQTFFRYADHGGPSLRQQDAYHFSNIDRFLRESHNRATQTYPMYNWKIMRFNYKIADFSRHEVLNSIIDDDIRQRALKKLDAIELAVLGL